MIFFCFLISVLLFVIGGKFIKDISLLMAGFNLIFSNKDFLDLGLSDNLVMATAIFGVLLLIIGMVILTRSTTEDYVHEIFGF